MVGYKIQVLVLLLKIYLDSVFGIGEIPLLLVILAGYIRGERGVKLSCVVPPRDRTMESHATSDRGPFSPLLQASTADGYTL